MPKVFFSPAEKEIEVAPGEDILAAAAKADIHINASCGGEGTCGKCKVHIAGAKLETKSTAKLTEEELAKGYVLACQTPVFEDVRVEIPTESDLLAKGRSRIKTLTAGIDNWNRELAALDHDPPVRKIFLDLPEPSLDDSVSDLTRVTREVRRRLDVADVLVDLETVKKLPEIIRTGGWKVTVTVFREAQHNRISRVEPGNTADRHYALAVDIGTTTCSAQLIDLNRRLILAEASEYNAQIGYGEDVISRMVYAKKPQGLKVLQKKVVQTIDKLAADLSAKTGVAAEAIDIAVLAGNTIMTHLILGVATDQIREAPYVPAFRFAPSVTARELGFRTVPDVPLIFHPCVASYLGGDITAGVVAANVAAHENLVLYIDIGTNGEIVLGNNEWMIGCSCSAGPAFEGAGVKDGIRSIDGAIERVSIEPETFETVFTTIGGKLPIGICGSGLIDLVAELFKAGVIDKRGKFHRDLSTDRVRAGEYGWEFVVVWARVAGVDRDIVITEIDIDNLMRAKAAVYAGITTLAAGVGVDLADVTEIMIAGSFGNYIKVEEAVAIGLLPDLPIERFKFVGNCSLLGSAKAALSRDILKRAAEITRSMTYMELSADNTFMDKYISALFLPHTDESLFPSVRAG